MSDHSKLSTKIEKQKVIFWVFGSSFIFLCYCYLLLFFDLSVHEKFIEGEMENEKKKAYLAIGSFALSPSSSKFGGKV